MPPSRPLLNGITEKGRAVRYKLLRRFRPRTPTLRQVRYRGMTLAVLANEALGWRLLATGEYESAELNCLERLIQPDDLCVDVGANVGLYSVFMARCAPQGTVLAFEPVPFNRSLLEVNRHLNGLRNLEVHPHAVSDRVGITEFTVSADAAYSSMRDTGRKAAVDRLEVRTTTLDEMLSTQDRPARVVKIDVEGAELLVLRGASRVLADRARRPRAILVEANPVNQAVYGTAPSDLIAFVESFGYCAHSILTSGLKTGWPTEGASEDVLFLETAVTR